MEAIALVDGNNFYASCEQSINPALREKPIVILSNNDGCIIARSPEARLLRIKMGVPYFKIKDRLSDLGVIVLSSNYSLYGDISKRFMNLLKRYSERIEIYSIDEAFLLIKRPQNNDLHPWARQLRSFIYQNIGLTITIGIAENKVKAKLANRLAKRISNSAGIFDLGNIEEQNDCSQEISVNNIWGIGGKTSNWLSNKGIKTVKEFKSMNEYEINQKLGIAGKRLQLELKGYRCLPIEDSKKEKKTIQVSRSFGQPITKLEDLEQAITFFTIKAAEKMRIQNLKASKITLFARSSYFSEPIYQKSITQELLNPTNNTFILLKIVNKLTKKIFNSDYKLSKAGILMQDLTNCKYTQKSILTIDSEKRMIKEEKLIETIDYLNQKFNSEVVTWAITQKTQPWQMNKNLLSGTSTTDIKRIPIIII